MCKDTNLVNKSLRFGRLLIIQRSFKSLFGHSLIVEAVFCRRWLQLFPNLFKLKQFLAVQLLKVLSGDGCQMLGFGAGCLSRPGALALFRSPYSRPHHQCWQIEHRCNLHYVTIILLSCHPSKVHRAVTVTVFFQCCRSMNKAMFHFLSELAAYLYEISDLESVVVIRRAERLHQSSFL